MQTKSAWQKQMDEKKKEDLKKEKKAARKARNCESSPTLAGRGTRRATPPLWATETAVGNMVCGLMDCKVRDDSGATPLSEACATATLPPLRLVVAVVARARSCDHDRARAALPLSFFPCRPHLSSHSIPTRT